MSVKVSHKSFNGGAAGLLERITELSSHKIGVGVPSDRNDEGRESKGGKKEVGNADLVYIHTHGVRPTVVRREMQPMIETLGKYSVALQMYIASHGSFTMQIPARPIIEPAIEQRQEEVAESLKEALVSALNDGDYMKSLKMAGKNAQIIVQDYFEGDNGWEPNKDSTINGWTAPWIDKKTEKHKFFKGKGSDQPLISTGALRQSISFTVDGVIPNGD